MSRKTGFKGVAASLFALLFLLMAGCEFPDAYFVRVSSIGGVPETGEVNVPLALNATVYPDIASHKDINWSVKEAGGTETVISGNILTARSVGIVIISARISNGIMEGRDFVQDFEITISKDGIMPITKVTLTVPGPAKNRVPDTSPASVRPSSEDSGKYTVSEVKWSPEHVPFRGLMEYSVTVTLTATSNYMFTNQVAAKINNNNAVVKDNTGTTITLFHKFVATLDKEITGITVIKQPDKLTYTENEKLDLSGLVVTLTYDTGPLEEVPFSNFNSYSSISVQPEPDDPLSISDNGKPVVVSADIYSASTNSLTVNVAVATIGFERWFSSLGDAINGAENGTASEPTEIIILKDITASSGFSIPAGKNIRLNVEVGKHITIAANAGEFALFNVTNTDSSLALGPTSVNGTLTLTGNDLPASANRRGVYVKGGTLSMNSGVLITGFNNDRGDVFVANNGSSGHISLSGDATLNTLTLSADGAGNAFAEIASGWNAGYLGKLNLHGSGYPIASVIQQWKGKTVLQGSWLNASNVENINFKLWNFIDAQGNTQRMNKQEPPEAKYGYAIGDTGQDMGKLVVAQFNIYLEAQRYKEANADITITVPHDYVMPRPLVIPDPGTAGITLTIKGETATTKITRGTQDLAAGNGLFIVNSGVKLVFEGIVVDGNSSVHTGNAASLVRVNAGGTFTMNAGAVLQNNRATNGGGVYVVGSTSTTRGIFTMNDGSKIINNTATASGGGVYAGSYVTFDMNGDSKIINNTAATSGGGVYAGSSVTYTMYGGEISGNSGAGVYFYSSSGTFDMKGGEIKNNTGSSGYGVYVYSGTFTMSGSSAISGNSNSGVNVSSNGTFKMDGGEIRDNKASGVYVYGGTFTMNNDSKITNNTATNGGGVYVSGSSSYSGTFTMNNDSQITNNTATNGGGVYVSGYSSSYSGTFTMNNDSQITNNTATTNGGGVYVVNTSSIFNMYSGEINGNKTAGNGGGVYNNGTFRVGGIAKVSGNTRTDGTRSNAYITESAYITLGTPAPGMEIWAQTARADTIAVSSGGTETIKGYFKADRDEESVDVLSRMIIIGKLQLTNAEKDFYEKVQDYGGSTIDKIITVYENLNLPIPVNVLAPATSGKILTIQGVPSTVKLTRSTQDTTADNGLFKVNNGASLVFENIVIDGDMGEHTGNTVPLVRVNAGGTFTMNNGAVLQNNRATSGGGVYVDGNNTNKGTFIMNSGSKITNNTATATTTGSGGGGVYIGSYVTFTMDGGEISDNSGAGVYISGSNSTFTLTGGDIKTSTGYGVYVYGGAFNMSGGTISDNSNSGVYVYAYNSSVTFTMSGGTISGNTTSGNGGGVYVSGSSSYSGTFTMSGGTISGNTANGTGASNGGGGVYVYSYGTFTMSNGTISGNTANGTGTNNGGGGVYVYSGTFTMNNGTISGDNKAASNGGGVYVFNGSTFNMNGGEISGGNNATNGGGVYNNGTFTMYGGEISGNKATTNGGGVYNNATFTVGKTAKVYDNTKAGGTTRSNVYLPGTYIRLGTSTNAPADGMEIWAQTTKSNCIVVSSGATNVLLDYFNSDVDGKDVNVRAEEGWLLIGDSTEFPKPPSQTELDFYGEVQSYATKTEDFTIEVDADLTLTKTVNVPAPTTMPGITLTIKGSPSTVKLLRGTEDGTANSGLFVVNSGARLVFENIVIDGDKDNHTKNAAPLVYVKTGGTFTMNAGAVLQNNRAESGSAVYNNGTFTMSGGEIKNNTATTYGGGVYVNSGSFTMSGSTISGNTATLSGGGVYVVGTSSIRGTFTMNSGSKITNNTATATTTGSGGGGVYTSSYVTITMNDGEISGNSGAGLYFYSSNGIFDMKGGAISGNSSYGVYVYSGTFTMSGGAISGNSSYGVYVSSGTFNMSGGAISGNSSYGVYVYSGTFKMDSGEIKNHNTSSGVYVYGGTFTLNNGTISGNKATNGGGVYVYAYNSGVTFTMSGGTISGNTASSGGGVYVSGSSSYSSTFTMSGGTISGNTANGNGGGVYVSSNGTFNMNNSSKIINNTATNGGGVYVSGGTFNMNNGEISGNTATTNGGGVFNSSTFRVGGTAKVKDNTKTDNTTRSNAYITASTYITLGTPTSGMEIWAQTDRDDNVLVQYGATVAMQGYFKADEAGRTVVFDVNALVIK